MKSPSLGFAPGDEMPPVVGGQVDAVGLFVGRQDGAADVEDVVLAQVLLVDPQHVRRRGEVWSSCGRRI